MPSVLFSSACLAATKSVGPFPVRGPFPAVKGRLAESSSSSRIKIVRLVVTGIFLDPFGFGIEVECVLVISPRIEFRGWNTFLNLCLVGGTKIALLLSEETMSAMVLELVMTSGL